MSDYLTALVARSTGGLRARAGVPQLRRMPRFPPPGLGHRVVVAADPAKAPSPGLRPRASARAQSPPRAVVASDGLRLTRTEPTTPPVESAAPTGAAPVPADDRRAARVLTHAESESEPRARPPTVRGVGTPVVTHQSSGPAAPGPGPTPLSVRSRQPHRASGRTESVAPAIAAAPPAGPRIEVRIGRVEVRRAAPPPPPPRAPLAPRPGPRGFGELVAARRYVDRLAP